MRPIDYFDAAADQYGDRLAISDMRWPVTFEELRRASTRIARRLQPVASFENQGRVAFLSPNDPRLIACTLGAMRAGAVVAPLHSHQSGESLTAAIQRVQPVVVVAHESLEQRARSVIHNSGRRCELLTLGEVVADMDVNEPRGLDWGDVYGSQTHPVFVRQTSGSTGQPKTIVSDIASFATTHLVLHHVLRPTASEHPVCLIVAPLSHAAGVHAFVMLSLGATLVVLTEFEPAAVLNAIGQHGVTHLWLPPSALHLLVRHMENVREHYVVTSLRSIVLGASAVRPAILADAVRRFGPCVSINYSQIESGFLTWLDAGTIARAVNGECRHRLASSGKSLFASRIAIMDSEGNLLPAEARGEIVVRGPGVKPYIADGFVSDVAELTLAHRFGWHHTGDIGHFDGDGYLYVDGRLRDTVNMAGLKVSAEQIEAALTERPEVLECAVVAVPDEYRGEVVACIVVLREGSSLDRAEVGRYCTDRLGRAFAPRVIEYWSELPRTPLGKIDKSVVRARACRDGRTTAPRQLPTGRTCA